ncbi:MAG: class I SAM-dependent methyltransferase [Oligoflexia bacterium]
MVENPDAWQRLMYDDSFAAESIDSPDLHKLAKKEVAFLIRNLQLPKNARILDAPCGTGRHAVLFAQKGYSVTGIDINPLLLVRARRNSLKAKNGAQLQFIEGNLANLRDFRGSFDAVLNLFTSFGYMSTDQKNRLVLKHLIAALKPGGKLVIHLMNRDWLMRVFRPVDWSKSTHKFTLEARRYDPKSRFIEAQRIVLNERTGEASRQFHRIRLYSKPEMVRLMRECGLTRIRVFGDYQGAKFQRFQSTHPIYVGEVPKVREQSGIIRDESV